MLKSIERLACPVSGEELIFYRKDEAGKVGILLSSKSYFAYPVINSVPILLPYQTELQQIFFAEHSRFLKSLKVNYKLPDLPIPKGEKAIAASFGRQWLETKNSDLSFIYNSTDLVELHRNFWLHDLSSGCLENSSFVLDVGCGNGQEAVALSEIFPKSVIYAIDLNPNLLHLGRRITDASGGRVVPVIGSLWHLPFRKASFDHVHCQGVAHHTNSTEKAFKEISRFVNYSGTLLLWVYAWEDSLGIDGIRGIFVRLYWLISHNVGRPLLSRLPNRLRTICVWLITYLYAFIVFLTGRKNPQGWSMSNTFHGISDMFTPRFAAQLRWNQVIAWFTEEGFVKLSPQDSLYYERRFSRRPLGIGVLGYKQSQ